MQEHQGIWWPTKALNKQGANYQSEAREALIAASRKHDLAIDGGANVGIWSKGLCEAFAAVHAFECVPDVADYIPLNAPRAIVHKVAISDKSGPLFVEYDPNSIFHTHVSDKGLPVEARTLDEYGLSPDAIKLDVEGMEYQALRGAEQTILRYRPAILIEQKHSYQVEKFAARDWLESIGYAVIWTRRHDYLLTSQVLPSE